MALSLKLTDGTTELDLLGSVYGARRNTLDFGTPDLLRAMHGNIFQSSWGMTGHARGRRTVNMQLRVLSSTLADLTGALTDLQDALERTRSYAQFSIGTRWVLEYDPGTGITYSLGVQDGVFLQPPTDRNTNLRATNPHIAGGSLVLECDPFWEGPEETVENYVADPSFEVAGTPLADHTENITATGTTAQDSTQAKYGDKSLKLVMTNAGGSGEVVERTQVLLDVDGGETWSFAVWFHVTELTSCKAVLVALYNDSGGPTESTVERTTITSDWVQVRLEGELVPGDATQVTLKYRLESTAASATGAGYVDGLMAVEASTIPTAFVSGRAIKNHFDDDGQAHIPYIDIHPNAGDVPAKVQLKLTEAEAHTKVFIGARHAGRQYDDGLYHEGEDFSSFTSEPGDGTASGGAYGQFQPQPTIDAVSSSTGVNTQNQIHAHGCSGDDRLLLVGVTIWDDAPAHPTGITYGSAPALAMTLIASATIDANRRISWWRLVAPATGSHNIIVATAALRDRINVVAVSFEHVHQTVFLGAVATASGTSTTPGVPVVSDVGDLVIDLMGSAPASHAEDSAQTERAAQTNDVPVSTSTKRAEGASTDMDWTLGASVAWDIFGVAVKPVTAGAGNGTAAAPNVVTRAIAAPPRGRYQVLARLSNPDGGQWGVAMGYSYGGVTVDPVVSGNYSSIAAAQTAFHLLDVGTIVIPPGNVPDGSTVGTFTLRLAFYLLDSVDDNDYRLRCDYVLLRPVDFGSSYAEKASGADVVVPDSISREPQLTLLDSSDVFQSIPQQRGAPIYADPDGTRVYVLYDNGSGAAITLGATVAVRIVPRFLQVG